ncbi:NAD dehydrogenase [Cylindrobasidium torrendii FP15055 ss-10]|uniref:L-2-hydroxyglutarate dehydrogenase, mitochondrial n=1 Tax=Cylindrobasidium torrendii FP15055 ss-10 TaxID=1314674 RepID=A0A0D7AZ27_9AGAR|nr:NAD dehydrogenase [Cylindrobasidium torrendii FP15055 ss-10]
MASPIRGLRLALNAGGKFKAKAPEFSVDYLVVGGGVVGLALARFLAERYPGKSTYLVERHSRVGEETSSRNSEVLHSGLYYPPDSLKTRLCIRGRQMLYDYCSRAGVPHKKTGKLVVAQEHQMNYIQSLYAKSLTLQAPPKSNLAPTQVLPTKLISGDEARKMEPSLSPSIVGALWSPETGIVDSHALMESFEKDLVDTDGGEVVLSTSVVRVDPADANIGGWNVQMLTAGSEEPDPIHARTLINAAGLAAPYIINAILPSDQHIPMYFARGSYVSYKGPGVGGVQHLIYPCPETMANKNKDAFSGLGTHLTLDMEGKIKFGPDVEWLAPPGNDDVDFWREHLVPNDSRIGQMHQAVTSYLPGVTLEGMAMDYVGVRPKIAGPGAPFQDFVIQKDGQDESMISLLGIESPGLTSSMALAEYVVDGLIGIR